MQHLQLYVHKNTCPTLWLLKLFQDIFQVNIGNFTNYIQMSCIMNFAEILRLGFIAII